MPTCYLVVAKRLKADRAKLTGERYGIDSSTLTEMIETYHTAIGEEEPYFSWLEDAADIQTFEDVVDAELCTKPDVCLRTLMAFREGITANADILPPYTWIAERASGGTVGRRSTAARVTFQGAEWTVPGGWEPTVAREVGKGKKARTLDLRNISSWDCERPTGEQVVLEFERQPFDVHVQRDLDGLIAICEQARKVRGLVAITSVL